MELEKVLAWIDTMVERREIDDDEREVATVVARRHMEECDCNHLPKSIARKSIEIALEGDGERDTFTWEEM